MNFQIELKDNRQKARQSTSLHLITGFAMSGIGAFTFLLGNANWIQTVFHAPILPSVILGTISLLYGLVVLYFIFFRNKWLQISSNNKMIRLTSVNVCGILAIIFVLSQWWLASGIAGVAAAANLFALFYEQKLAQPLFVVFDVVNIQLPASSRSRQLEWQDVARVILRHGTITIDCTNNFLYQWTVKHNDVDALTFEAFCRAQIEANKTKRMNDDW